MPRLRTTKFGKSTFRYEAAVVWNRLPNKLPKVKDFAEFLLSFESIGHSVQEKTFKLNFQDNSRGGHLGFLIGTILAIFYLQVTLIPPIQFLVNWPFGSGKKSSK